MKRLLISLVLLLILNVSASSAVTQPPPPPTVTQDKSGFGIAPGIMYVACLHFKDNYVSNTIPSKDLNTITRVFPTITGYYKFGLGNGKESGVFLGGTIGVNEGVNNVGTGFALALGVTFGFTVKETVHFGLFVGAVLDPSVYNKNTGQETLGTFLATGLTFSISSS